MTKKLQNLSQWMKQESLDFCFLTNPDSVFYVSGFLSDPHERLLAVGLFADADPFLVCPAMEVEDAKKAGWGYSIIGYSDIENPWEMIHSKVTASVTRTEHLAIEKEHLNVERYEILRSLFPKADFASAEESLRKLRMIKSPKATVRVMSEQ